MATNTSIKYFRVLSYLLSMAVFLPVVTNNLPPLIGSYHLFAAIWISSLIFLKPKVFTNKIVIKYLVYVLFNVFIFAIILWHLMSDSNKILIRTEAYDLFIPLTVYAYFQLSGDKKGWAKFTKLSLIFIGITAIMTYIASSIVPEYSRYITAGMFSLEKLDFFKRIGGGTYGYNNALMGIFVMLVYLYKNNVRSIFTKIMLVLYLILFYGAVIRMQFFTNIIMVPVLIILAFSGRKKIRNSLVIIGMTGIIAFIIPNRIYSDTLLSLSSLFDVNSETYFKLNSTSDYIMGKGDNEAVELRANRYPELLNAFIKSPFLGDSWHNNGDNISLGYHLYWMNRLALWGIFGFSIWIWFHIQYLLHIIRQFDKQFDFYLILSLLGILSYGLMKNISGREVWYTYFVILPGVYYFPLLNKINK